MACEKVLALTVFNLDTKAELETELKMLGVDANLV